MWNGESIVYQDSDLTAGLGTLPPACTGPNAPLEVLSVLNGCTGSPAEWLGASGGPGVGYFFLLYPGSGSVFVDLANYNGDPYVTSDYGTLTLTEADPVATPEPGTFGLMLIGLGILGLVMRKRIAQALPQAS